MLEEEEMDSEDEELEDEELLGDELEDEEEDPPPQLERAIAPSAIMNPTFPLIAIFIS